MKPGSLYQKVTQTTKHALECGALVSIPTDFELLESNGVNFLVRILTNLIRKDKAKKKQDKNFNPFLPYEEDLFVEDISDTHVCILNKFNVVENHLLIITRNFEEQESLLTREDFSAMFSVLSEIDGLAFYNGGKLAGASQRHKHLQIVPLPLTNNGRIPIESLFINTNSTIKVDSQLNQDINQVNGLPFLHGFVRWNDCFKKFSLKSPLESSTLAWEYYCQTLQKLNLLNEGNKIGAYNLLVTREWIFIVPRKAEKFENISVNSLGFSGCLLVRDRQQMDLLKQVGAMNILKSVAVPIT